MPDSTPTVVADLDTPPTHATENDRLLRLIEAGTIAEAALRGWFTGSRAATTAELDTLAADGRRARAQFAELNAPLVTWVARPIARSTGHDLDELVQEGAIGLLEAIDRFDPTRSRFATYAVPRIRMRVWDAAVTSLGSLGMSPRRAREWRRARAASARLTMTLARRPLAEEVAGELGESVSVVRTLLAFAPPVTLAPDAAGWRLLAAEAEPEASDGVDRAAVRRLLRRLDDTDRWIVSQLYGLDGPARSHAEVAGDLGRSPSTVRRRERQALELLRAGTDDLLAA